MATEAKRPRVDPAGASSADSSGDPLPAFLDWCAEQGVELSAKVCVSREGTVADYGLVAREDLEVGETLFTVPRTALLSQHTSSLASLLEKEKDFLESPSGWIPLLISLLHESTASNSRWAPYLSLWPGFSGLDQPMFWSDEERKRLLQGTGLPEAVDKDLANIQEEYSSIVLPFLEAHPGIFQPAAQSLELYKRLVAFVMAYSFQEPLDDEDEDEDEEEPNPPVMVPLADLLNHVANHNANLEYFPDCLKMVATRPICKGQEVFNTYGEMANWQLLHMYGFAEPYPGNINDAADVQMSTLLQAALQGAKTEGERQLAREQWDCLCRLELVGEEGAFVFGWEKNLTEEELFMALKLLTMSAEEFEEFKAQDLETREGPWTEGSELLKATIPAFQAAWKQLLREAIRLSLASFSSGLEEEEETLQDPEAYARLSQRERHALQVRYGQKKILHQLLQLSQ